MTDATAVQSAISSPAAAFIRDRERTKAASAAAAAAALREQASPAYWLAVLDDAAAAQGSAPIAADVADRLVSVLEDAGRTLADFERDSALLQTAARLACGETVSDARARFQARRMQHAEQSARQPAADLVEAAQRGRLLEAIDLDEAFAVAAIESAGERLAETRQVLRERGCPSAFLDPTPAGAAATA